MPGNTGHSEYTKGMAALITSMVMWGVLPVYWKSLIPIDSWVIILYRILLVNVFALLIARSRHSWKEIFGYFATDRKTVLKLFAAGAVVTVNWSTYIWGVNAGHIIQTSIGYYIEPLVVCLFGMVIFREKLTAFKTIALLLAFAAMIIQLIHFHQIPGIALGLASTFAVYTAIKKTVTLPPLISLVYETIIFAPFALAAILWLETGGKGALAAGEPYQFALLLLCGLLTVIPLGLFSYSAQRVPMFTLGIIEYLSPTIGMLLGIFAYNEPFDRVLFISFVIIWTGLVFFTVGERKELRLSGREN